MALILEPNRPIDLKDQIIDLTDEGIYDDDELERSTKYLIDCGLSPEEAAAAVALEFQLTE